MNIEDLKQQLIRHEGLELLPYKCTAGKLTIGVGRNIEDRGISYDEAMFLLENDLMLYTAELEKSFPVVKDLNDVRVLTLLNMAFNLGITKLRQFKMMWAAIEDNDFEAASQEMLNSKWARDVGNRSLELSEQMRTGLYKP
jgi:lysozyme